MNTIRTRLLLWLLSAVAAAGLSGAWAVYDRALQGLDELFDEQLQQTALSLQDQSFDSSLLPQIPATDTRNNVVIQVWNVAGVRIYLSEFYRAPPGLQDSGLSTVTVNKVAWRVFSLPSRSHIIQVSQPLSVRRRQAASLALSTLAPLGLMLPVLGVAIWLIVGTQLRPLRRLADSLRLRQPDALEPVGESGLPEELRPLVSALNGLLARLQAALEAQQAFVADAAHELRTPLTALRLQLQLAADADEETARKDALARLRAGIDRASRLVEQLLDLARQQAQPASAGQQSVVALDELARDVVAGLVPLAELRQQDLGIAASEAASVRGDSHALGMLCRNLVDNALRYTPEQGRIDVMVGHEGKRPFMRVSDTGPGIPETERERVFGRFVRVGNGGTQGTGLGLAIVQSIASNHHADIRLGDGPEGRGLEVTVLFPATSAALSHS